MKLINLLIYIAVIFAGITDQSLINFQMRNFWVVNYQLGERKSSPPTGHSSSFYCLDTGLKKLVCMSMQDVERLKREIIQNA